MWSGVLRSEIFEKYNVKNWEELLKRYHWGKVNRGQSKSVNIRGGGINKALILNG